MSAITKTFSVTTKEITKEQIWKLMSDVNRWNTWDKSVEHSEIHGDFKTGTFFTLKPVNVPKVKIQLVEVRPDTYFKDLTIFPLAKMTGEHTYEDTPDGLKLTVTMTITGPLAFLWNKLVMQDIVNHLSEDLQQQITAAKKFSL